MVIRSIQVAALAIACACSGSAAPEQPAKEGGSGPVERDTVVRSARIGSLGTVMDSLVFDVDGDGSVESVELGVNTGPDENGEMLWDVHNEWSVVVRDGPDSYPLLRESLPGVAAFWVVVDDSARPAIMVQVSNLTTGSSGTRLEKFVFDRARGGYVRTGKVEGWGRGFYRGPKGFEDVLPPTSWRGNEPEWVGTQSN